MRADHAAPTLFLMVALVSAPGVAGAATGVIDTDAAKITPAVDTGYIGWAANTKNHPRHFDAFVKPTGERRIQLNRHGTKGFMGGIDGHTATFEQIRRRSGDIKFFDLLSRESSNPPAGVNTDLWEYAPSNSGDYLLFGRFKAQNSAERIILFNTTTLESQTLADVKGDRKFLYPGQLNGHWGVWFKCASGRCDVFLFDIAAQVTTMIPNPERRFQYAPSVTSTGTVYFVRGTSSCRRHVAIYKRPLGGTTSKLFDPSGRTDMGSTFAFETAGGVEVYFSLYDCYHGWWDIFREDD